MIAWALYVTVVALVAGVAGLLAEGGLARLGRPVRGAWIWSMLVTLAIPVVAATRSGAAGSSAIWSGGRASAGSAASEVVFMAVWATLSLVLLASMRLSAWTIRRNERSWRSGRLAGQPMVVSSSFGPGVIGARRPRVVLPEWVMGAPPSLQDLIVRHELEHVRARDSWLLTGGLLVVVLLPWCFPLWWQLHRLRGAVERDCDARVLAAGGEAGTYARALVEVAGRVGRRTAGLGRPIPSFGPRRGELERRIRWITAREGRSRKSAALGAVAAVAVAAALLLVPAPRLPALGLESRVTDVQRPASVTVILTIGGAPVVESPAR